jgi:daunorubicin resistance ABC transporter ATP-binding subunit
LSDAAILVEGLTKRFGTLRALDGIDFAVPPGAVFGLLGPNGAGKTTAVRVLATILRPDGGRAEVMGLDVVRQAAAVRFQIGLAGQSAAVDANLSGRENLRLIGRLAQMRRRDVGPRADELLERFDLSDAADRPVRTYSGGMRRRLDVAAALVQRPPVLFLDEPTTGLDIQSRTELWAVIRELVAEGSTVLLTTQYLEEADRLADRIAVVDHGHIVANDTSARLKAQLAGTVIEIGMQDEERASRAHDVLVRAVADHPQRDGTTVRLTSNEGPSALIEALRLLDTNALSPATLTVREPSLDDAFLALTGRRPDDVEEGESGDDSHGRRSRGDPDGDESGDREGDRRGRTEGRNQAASEAREDAEARSVAESLGERRIDPDRRSAA